MKWFKFFSVILTLAVGMSIASGEKRDKCGGGNQDPLKEKQKERKPGDEAGMAVMMAVDPNELDGPAGVDSVRWVSVSDLLNYTIFFENDPEFATAHAQIVDVRFNFPDKKLMKGFALGRYGFSNMAFEIPDAPSIYSTRIDLKDSLDIYADFHAGIDVTKNQGFWRFKTIDPATGYAPWQIDRGVLPVNDSTHVGEGFVMFSLRPHEDMKTGDTISFNANIVFDSNDTIPTNWWKVTVDAGLPHSKLTAEADKDDPNLYRLRFEASDDEGGSGIKDVALCLADNMGVYREYAVCAADSVVEFAVEPGRQYNFMTIACDRAGNKEEGKMKPDLTLNFNEAPTDLILSADTFADDIEPDGFIAQLSSVDSDEEGGFTYALAEGEGAVHNDLFTVAGDRLQAAQSFKCAEDTVYKIRLSTTDCGGMSFSKAFALKMERVLEQPRADTLHVKICEGSRFAFHGEEYAQAGTHTVRVANEFMCDSVYLLEVTVHPVPEKPQVTVKGRATLVSSAETGNQWFKDGIPVDGATGKEFTATEDGIYHVTVSNGICESESSEDYSVSLAEIVEINRNLTKGWNWISSRIATATDPSGFFGSVLDNLATVRGATGEMKVVNGGLQGDLPSIVAATYKVEMNAPDLLKLKGEAVDPAETTVSVYPGWNWIPYLPSVELGVEEALAGLQPKENDLVKSHTQFAVYANGAWKGTLKTMKPDEGYMYSTQRTAEFHFPESCVSAMRMPAMTSEEGVAPWSCDETRFADNATIVAEVFDGEAKAIDGTFTIGAFCGKDCRGVGSYIDGNLFITVHGQAGEKIRFVAIENATGNEAEVSETYQFDENPCGTVAEPFKLTVAPSGAVDRLYLAGLTIYPNPVRDLMFIEGDTDDVKCVKVITTNGLTLVSTDSFEHGVDCSFLADGVYVAALVTDRRVVYRKFLKKGF